MIAVEAVLRGILSGEVNDVADAGNIAKNSDGLARCTGIRCCASWLMITAASSITRPMMAI